MCIWTHLPKKPVDLSPAFGKVQEVISKYIYRASAI
jgi:hypothetical protein